MRYYSIIKLAATAVWCTLFVAQSFSLGRSHQPSYHIKTRLDMVGGGEFDGGALTSALARLDQQWAIQQRTKGTKSNRWTKLVLSKEDQDTSEKETSERTTDAPFVPPSQAQEDFVYLLEPDTLSSIPSCLIVFTGGAGLGQFPHIAYNEFLSRISNRLNAAILAVPYQVGLDHFDISKKAGEKLRKAIVQCQEDPSKQYPASLPTYSLAHSLGAKLQTIYLAATQQEFSGIGYLSFNNFGFAQTIEMARTFAQQLRGGPVLDNDAIKGIFDLAETAIGMLGVEFTPNPADMERLVQLKVTPEIQKKTRLFVFEEDSLDCTRSFVESCERGKGDSDSGADGPSISGLPGNHLTPVYLKFGLQDIELPEEARSMASEVSGGFESASFGSEPDLDALVDEVCDWILGKGPSRAPNWDGTVAEQRQEPWRLSGEAKVEGK